MDLKTDMYNLRMHIKDELMEGTEQYCAEKLHDARKNQQENDIIVAVMGFIDLKADDMRIMELLQKYFKINRISEAKDYITKARCFYQSDKLQTYLGLKGSDWVRYKKDNRLFDKLQSDPKLLVMPIEKLKTAIEKK